MGFLGPIIFLSSFNAGRDGGSYIDPRPRCKECGQILPRYSGFRKWLRSSPIGIAVSVAMPMLLGFYVMFTIIGWLVQGNFDDSFHGAPQTLFQYATSQGRWIWLMMHRLW